VDKNDEKQIVS